MSKGIVIIALGHQYYGNYAMQLCRSIKSNDKDVSITLLYGKSAITHIEPYLNEFNDTIEIPFEYYTTNGLTDYLKAKTHLFDLSKYDKTIYIDADVIATPFRKISELFVELDGTGIIIGNRGKEELIKAKKGFIHWTDPKEIREVYGDKGYLYNLSSEFIYFEKCSQTELFFEFVKDAYLNPIVKYKKFAHHLPDELAFNIAMIKTNTNFTSPFIPFYWEQFEKKSTRKSKTTQEIYKEYYGYSMGGNLNTTDQEQIYNNLASISNKAFNVKGYFPAKSKKNWLIERKEL